MKNLAIAVLFLIAVFSGGCSLILMLSALGDPSSLVLALPNLLVAVICILVGRSLSMTAREPPPDDPPE